MSIPTPPFTPSSGMRAALKFGTAIVPATNWKLSIDPKIKDISNFLTGRLKMGTLPDCKLTTTIIWNTSEMPTDPAGLNIVAGATAVARCFVDETHFFEVPGIISKLDPHLSSIEDVVMEDIELDLSGGDIIYPVIP
jgi:hypothetical protein